MTMELQLRPARAMMSLLAGLLLGLPAAQLLAATTHPALVQPAASGEAKTARKAVLKQRTATVPGLVRHPGKTVGGTGTALPKTVMTKRTLPK